MAQTASRKIIHVDMDAFYASVEQRDDPDLRGRPVAVGGSPDRRGVVAAASYEARRFGVHSAMSSARAIRQCPELVFVRPRFAVYREVSQQIRAVFAQYTALIEPLSLDEAYLDVSDCKHCRGSATLIARQIKQDIHEVTWLTASAGVSYNKFLAKTASDMDKPDGLTVVTPDCAQAVLDALPIGKFYGIGKATEKRMRAVGVSNGAELRMLDQKTLARHFGKAGLWYYRIVRGDDPRPVRVDRQRKSFGSETTFVEDLMDRDAVLNEVGKLARQVGEGAAERRLMAQAVTLKVKYSDFTQITRSHSVDGALTCADDLLPLLEPLLARTEAGSRPIRLLGVTLSRFVTEDDVQLALL